MERCDVIVVGGGPSGLSAALLLGRARRSVLVLDEGQPRNAASRGVHALLTREGTPPFELLRLAREELSRYPTVSMKTARVVQARRHEGGFEVRTAADDVFHGRKLVLATGVVDELPALSGLRERYGKSVFHCPYCDGFEVSGQPLAAYGRGERDGARLALELLGWSRDVVLCTDGAARCSEATREQLVRNHIRVREEPVVRLEGRDGELERIVFASGPPLERRAMFIVTEKRHTHDLAAQLDSDVLDPHTDSPDRMGRSDVGGLYVVGDASRDVLLVAVAIGEGAQAGVAIHAELAREDLA